VCTIITLQRYFLFLILPVQKFLSCAPTLLGRNLSLCATMHRERQVIPLTCLPKPSKSITFLRSYKQLPLSAHQNPIRVPLLPAHQNPVRALLLLRLISNNYCLLIASNNITLTCSPKPSKNVAYPETHKQQLLTCSPNFGKSVVFLERHKHNYCLFNKTR